MRLALKLHRGGIIPRDPDMTIRMRRLPIAEPAPAVRTVRIGAGADMFADATEIPFEEFRDIVAAYTYNKALTEEVGDPNAEFFDQSYRTAWWKIFVPAGEFCYVDADTHLSFGSTIAPGTSEPDSPDTNLGIYRLDDGDGLGDLQDIKTNEDVDGGVYTSVIKAAKLDGDAGGGADGTWFYIQVGQYSDGPDICYVLRLSLRKSYPWTIPADGVDPASV